MRPDQKIDVPVDKDMEAPVHDTPKEIEEGFVDTGGEVGPLTRRNKRVHPEFLI